MLEEITKTVAKKTGLTNEKAKVVVELVVDLLKQKMPAQLRAPFEGFLEGKTPDLGDAAGMLGGLFGGKK